jgi:hypothetical protein
MLTWKNFKNILMKIYPKGLKFKILAKLASDSKLKLEVSLLCKIASVSKS